MNALPQELIDYILDYLFDDKQSLLLSSTVSKSWLPACSFHLFATFTIRLHNSVRDECLSNSLGYFDPITEILSQTTRMNAHIKHLVIACRGFAAPAHPFDVVALGRLMEPLPKLENLTLHGINLFSTYSAHAHLPRGSLSNLYIEESRLDSDALRALFALFAQVDQVHLTRILSIDPPSTPTTPTPTPGPASLPSFITPPTTGVHALMYSSCPRAQLSALVTPLLASITTGNGLLLDFKNILLDDMQAVDEHLAAFGSKVIHLRVEIPDRWFSWDPPETNFERLEQSIRLPSMSRLAGLRTLCLFIPIKMTHTAVHINRYMWTRTTDIIRSLPGPATFPSLSPSASHSLVSRRLTQEQTHAQFHLDRLRIICGDPRWFALAEAPYVLSVVRALDWARLDDIVAHTGLDFSSRNGDEMPSLEEIHRPQTFGDTATDGDDEMSSRKPLQIAISCRHARHTEFGKALLQKVSPRVRNVLTFVHSP